MFCCTTCIIAFIILFTNIYIVISCSKTEKNDFINVLNKQQISTYQKIIDERKNIYFMGYILGIILSIFMIYFVKSIYKNFKLTNKYIVCLVGSTTLITNYLFYILYPKTNYMLLHLNDKKQIEEWLKIYKKMQYKYHLGFVLGIIAAMIFSYSFRN